MARHERILPQLRAQKRVAACRGASGICARTHIQAPKIYAYYEADNKPTSRPNQDARQHFLGESSMVLRPGILLFPALLCAAACAAAATAPRTAAGDATAAQDAADAQAGETPRHLRDAKQVTQGSVAINGRALSYQAEAGVLVVHVKDPMDEEPAPLPSEETQGAPPPRSRRRRACPMSPISGATRKTRAVPSLFSTTAAPAHRRCGCTWARSAPSGW